MDYFMILLKKTRLQLGFSIAIPLREIARNCSGIARNFQEFTGLAIARK